jgi:hypothetical protein
MVAIFFEFAEFLVVMFAFSLPPSSPPVVGGERGGVAWSLLQVHVLVLGCVLPLWHLACCGPGRSPMASSSRARILLGGGHEPI